MSGRSIVSTSGHIKSSVAANLRKRENNRGMRPARKARAHTLRVWGKKSSWDYNVELVYQFGSFGDADISAWTAASETGYTFANLLQRLGNRSANRIQPWLRANTCIDCTARYAVELGYHVTLIKDGIGSFNQDEIKATVEITFPNYGHALLTAAQFVEVLERKS